MATRQAIELARNQSGHTLGESMLAQGSSQVASSTGQGGKTAGFSRPDLTELAPTYDQHSEHKLLNSCFNNGGNTNRILIHRIKTNRILDSYTHQSDFDFVIRVKTSRVLEPMK
jgi:hypothetical protein